jgi:hypothetical protein
MKRSYIKRSGPKRHTAAEKAYLGAVASLGCAVCRHLGYGESPAIVHHQRTGMGKMRASHYQTVPLCPKHHQDSGYGVHDIGREEFATLYGVSEVELVEQTRATLAYLIPTGE